MEDDPIVKTSYSQNQLAEFVRDGVSALVKIEHGNDAFQSVIDDAKGEGFDPDAVAACIRHSYRHNHKGEIDEKKSVLNLYKGSLAGLVPGFSKQNDQ